MSSSSSSVDPGSVNGAIQALTETLLAEGSDIAKIKASRHLLEQKVKAKDVELTSLKAAVDHYEPVALRMVQAHAKAWYDEATVDPDVYSPAESIVNSDGTVLKTVLKPKALRLKALHKTLAVIQRHRSQMAETQALIKGSVRVFCRLRGYHPAPHGADSRTKKMFVKITDQWSTQLEVVPSSNLPASKAQFERIFNTEATTGEVFDSLGWMLKAATRYREDCALFAYGPSGSGKTYTMQGQRQPSRSDPSMVSYIQPAGTPITTSKPPTVDAHTKDPVNSGLYYRFVESLLSSQHDINGKKLYELRIAVLQIHPGGPPLDQEKYVPRTNNTEEYDYSPYEDLLRPVPRKAKKSSLPPLQRVIRDVPPYEYYPNDNDVHKYLEDRKIGDVRDFLSVLDDINERRVQASTKQNKTSSRSHLVVHFILTHLDSQSSNVLSIVDLAGSEFSSSTDTKGLDQSSRGINQSLVYLRQAIREYGKNTVAPTGPEGAIVRHLHKAMKASTAGKVAFILQINPFYPNIERGKSSTDLESINRRLIVSDSRQANEFKDSHTVKRSKSELKGYIEEMQASRDVIQQLSLSGNPYAQQLLTKPSEPSSLSQHDLDAYKTSFEVFNLMQQANEYSQEQVKTLESTITAVPLTSEDEAYFNSFLSIPQSSTGSGSTTAKRTFLGTLNIDTSPPERVALFNIFSRRFGMYGDLNTSPDVEVQLERFLSAMKSDTVHDTFQPYIRDELEFANNMVLIHRFNAELGKTMSMRVEKDRYLAHRDKIVRYYMDHTAVAERSKNAIDVQVNLLQENTFTGSAAFDEGVALLKKVEKYITDEKGYKSDEDVRAVVDMEAKREQEEADRLEAELAAEQKLVIDRLTHQFTRLKAIDDEHQKLEASNIKKDKDRILELELEAKELKHQMLITQVKAEQIGIESDRQQAILNALHFVDPSPPPLTITVTPPPVIVQAASPAPTPTPRVKIEPPSSSSSSSSTQSPSPSSPSVSPEPAPLVSIPTNQNDIANKFIQEHNALITLIKKIKPKTYRSRGPNELINTDEYNKDIDVVTKNLLLYESVKTPEGLKKIEDSYAYKTKHATNVAKQLAQYKDAIVWYAADALYNEVQKRSHQLQIFVQQDATPQQQREWQEGYNTMKEQWNDINRNSIVNGSDMVKIVNAKLEKSGDPDGALPFNEKMKVVAERFIRVSYIKTEPLIASKEWLGMIT